MFDRFYHLLCIDNLHTGALPNTEFSKGDWGSSLRKLEIVNTGVNVIMVNNWNSKFKNEDVLRGCAFCISILGAHPDVVN